MLTRPGSVTDDDIRVALTEGWSMHIERVRYAPVGFGSHHWFATGQDTRLFVTVDDLAAKRRPTDDSFDAPYTRLWRALRTARDLADVGHSFVVAPVRGTDGDIVGQLDERFTIACFPYLDGRVGEFGEFCSNGDRETVTAHLAALHGLDPEEAPHCGIEDFVLASQDVLREAIRDVSASWDAGPFSEGARRLLAAHESAVMNLVDRHDQAVLEVRGSEDGWRLTHGEPHGSNTLATRNGVKLIDWDTALLAPPERDLWHLADDNRTVVDLYRRAGGPEIDLERLDLYRMHWDLDEIAGYIALLRAEHDDTDDIRKSFQNLVHYLQSAHRWLP